MKQTLKKLIHEALTLFLTRLYQSTQTQMDSIFFSIWILYLLSSVTGLPELGMPTIPKQSLGMFLKMQILIQ